MLNKLKESKLSRLGRDENKEAASRLSVLLWVDTKFLHSRKERCAINAKPRGSSISTTDATPALGKCAYNLVALLLCVFLNNSVFVLSPICAFSSDALVFPEDSVCGLVRVCLSEFSEWTSVNTDSKGAPLYIALYHSISYAALSRLKFG
jgi:hypothetical protein